MGGQWDSNSDSEIGRLGDKNSHMSDIVFLILIIECSNVPVVSSLF